MKFRLLPAYPLFVFPTLALLALLGWRAGAWLTAAQAAPATAALMDCPPLILNANNNTGSAQYPGVNGNQAGRLFRDGDTSRCGANKATPAITEAGTNFQFNTYTFTNTSAAPACLSVAISNSGSPLLMAAYLGTFNPNNVQQNYLADAGSVGPGKSFSFTVPANQNFVVVFSRTTTSAVTINYSFSLIGLPGCQLCPPTTKIDGVFATGSTDYLAQRNTQDGRLTRDGSPSACGQNAPAPTVLSAGTLFDFNAYSFVNTAASPLCFTVVTANDSSSPIFATAYLDSFDQGDIQQNYLADAGSSGPLQVFSFTVPAQRAFVVVLSRTTTVAATINYRFSVRGLPGCASCTGVTVAPTSLPAGKVSQAYNQTITAAGGTAPHRFAVIGDTLPPGLSLNATTGAITGTPSTNGSFNFTVGAYDQNLCQGLRNYTLNIQPAAGCTFSLNGMILNTTSVGSAQSIAVTAPNGCAWTATSNAAFLTLSGATADVGNGTQNFNVAANTGPPRSGSLTVAGINFIVNQAAPPAATLAALTPNLAVKSSGAFTLTLTGVNFPAASQVRWNGASRPTMFVSNTQVRASIPPSDLSAEGIFTVTVFDTASLQASNGLPFRVVGPLANVSAASYLNVGVAPDSIVAAFGTEMATAVQAAGSVPLPTVLAGTTVRVIDSANMERLAPLFFVSAGQVNYLMPAGTALGTATVVVTSGTGHISLATVEIVKAAPGIFTANAAGTGFAAAQVVRVKPNGTQIFENVVRFDQATQQFLAIPIDLTVAGDAVVLVLYGTGIRGRSALDAVNLTVAPNTALAAGYAGATGLAGLDQINALLPNALAGGGERNVTLTVDGKAANTIKLTFK